MEDAGLEPTYEEKMRVPPPPPPGLVCRRMNRVYRSKYFSENASTS